MFWRLPEIPGMACAVLVIRDLVVIVLVMLLKMFDLLVSNSFNIPGSLYF
jgi:hypothetical protein